MKTEALDVMKNRRSIRAFKPEPIPEQDLDAILEAGIYAPNGGGKQGFRIVAVRDPATVAKLDELNAKMLQADPAATHPYYGAPVILLVLATEEAVTPVEDCSAVACNLLNAAYAAGLGSCWVHRSKGMFETAEGKELLKEWGLPENAAGVVSIALGYADSSHPAPAPRKSELILKV